MARVARNKLRPFPRVDIVNASFEEAQLPTAAFDLVYIATAFHRIPAEAKFARSHALLKPFGHLAIIHRHHVSDVSLGPDVSARVSLDLALIVGAPCSSYTHQGQIALLRTTVAGNVGSRPLDPQRQDTKSLGLNFPPPCWKRRPRRLQRAPPLPLAFASSPRTRRTSHFSRCFPWSSSRRAPSVAQIPRYALFQLLAPPLDFRAREILVAVIHGLELAAIDRNACFR